MAHTPSKLTKPKFYETEAFQELETKWKAKLEKAGFRDIEYSDGKLNSYTEFTRGGYKGYKSRQPYYESVEEYYRMAGHFEHDHHFSNDKDKLVWKLHAAGISERNIVKELTSRGYKTYKLQVHNIIQKLEKIMLDKLNVG